jgi:hypothetical protein
MKKLVTLAVASLFAANLAFAQPSAAPAGNCESRAVSKEGKPLHGAAKAAFMKKCVHDNPAPAAAPGGKSAQQEKMKACNANAQGKKGEERKAFMKDCLSK